MQLVVGFSLLVALFVGALAVGTEKLLRQSIIDTAVSGAEQTGRVFADQELGHEEYRHGELAPTASRDLDVAVRKSSWVRSAKIWGPDGQAVYSSEGRSGAIEAGQAGTLRAAFGGTIQSDTSSGGDEGQGSERLLAVYVPITLPGDRRPRSVLEVALPYAPVQASIDRHTQSLALVLGVVALLFYFALLPSVLRGSRTLADHYEGRQIPLQRRLRRAIRNDELELHYQPKLNLRSGQVEGVEALLRWPLRDGTMVPPTDFIPLVEATAVMGELTAHVFELALRQSAAWRRAGIDLGVAVNISPCDLRDPHLPGRLARRAAAHEVRPEHITLEVTESAMSQSLDRDLQTLIALRGQGFRLSIDDFGTGESSLSRVHAVEFQEVKIDRSFIGRLDDERGQALVAGIIDLAQALGAKVVAEGVESEAAALRLAELGCDEIQGYHLACPLPPQELLDWLREHRWGGWDDGGASASAPRQAGLARSQQNGEPMVPRTMALSHAATTGAPGALERQAREHRAEGPGIVSGQPR